MVLKEEGICPYKIIDDFGSGFSLGIALGSIFHFIRGAYISSKKEKFFGGIMQLKKKAPILGGSFAVWTGTFAFCHCVLLSITKEESIKNQIISGAFTGGAISLRGGFYSFLRGAINGGLFLALIEIFQEYQMKKQIALIYNKQLIDEEMQLYQFLGNSNPQLEKQLNYKKNELIKESIKLGLM